MRTSISALSAYGRISGLTTSNVTSRILMINYSKPGQTSKLKIGLDSALKRMHQDTKRNKLLRKN